MTPPNQESERMFIDSGGAFSFFDATFAVALTLLVTSLAPTVSAWESWSALWDESGMPLIAFALSFLLISVYWWNNRMFLSGLRGIPPRIVFLQMVMLAFVVLLPVTTNALGEVSANADEIPTILYAINIAMISMVMALEYLAARAEGVLEPIPSSRTVRIEMTDRLIVPAVFLASIPIALFLSPSLARWSWASLVVLSRLTGLRVRRNRQVA